MDIKEKKSNNLILILLLLVATMVSFYCRIFYGWDQDQSYLTLLAVKLSSGSIMFKDLWDLHQTSMIWGAFLSRAFWTVKGSWDGIGVYLRITSVIVQAGVALFGYHELKKYFNRFASFLAAAIVANMLPRATQNIEYGAISVGFRLLQHLLLLMLIDLIKKSS